MKTANESTGDLPKVHDLKGMLQYQDKSVVSRMLAKNSGGSVTLFAFDRGEGLSEHTAPFDALVIGVEGKAEFTMEFSRYLQVPEAIAQELITKAADKAKSSSSSK